MSFERDLLMIRDAALRAVDPAQAVSRVLRRNGSCLDVDQAVWRIGEEIQHLFVISVGKAAVPMMTAAIEILGSTLTRGVLVTKAGHASGYTFPDTVEVFEAGHPVPDDGGLRGAQAVVRLLHKVTGCDLVLVLLSGGASALLPAPVSGLSLDDLQVTTDLLLRSGATINEINSVRKHLSFLKGGQLARLAAPAPVVALILSDVVGDPLDVIASGPTAPDPTTYVDAWDLLARYNLRDQVPPVVAQHLRAGVEEARPETPKLGDALFNNVTNILVGSNHLAARAAVVEAERLGYVSLLLTTFVEGEAREVAHVAAALAKAVRVYGDPLSPPACLVWGGETTVTVRGKGKGGRNQELALAAAIALEGTPGVALMALATDGTDGPTDAAGAIVTGETVTQAHALGLNPLASLLNNDAYPLLDHVGALLRTGPTGTNVNDLLVILVR